MRLKIAIPESHVAPRILNAGLEAVTRLNESLLQNNEVPSFERALRYGVRWRPEPVGDEHFDSADQVIGRKWGDCDDLAPWHAASLRHSGEDPGATAVVRRSGPKRWHAVVRRSDGSIDDPSKRAGMGPNVAPGVFGAAVPFMLPPSAVVGGAYEIRPSIAVRPVYGELQARADLPWQWHEHEVLDKPNANDIAMTALHTAPVASTALVGAIDDAIRLANCCGAGDPEHIARLSAIADGCEGATYEELAELYGPDHARAAAVAVVGIFGGLKKLGRGIGKLAKGALPIVSKGLQFVPGVGPIASTALDAGSKVLRGGRRPPPPAAVRSNPPPGAPPGVSRGAPVHLRMPGDRSPIVVHFH